MAEPGTTVAVVKAVKAGVAKLTGGKLTAGKLAKRQALGAARSKAQGSGGLDGLVNSLILIVIGLPVLVIIVVVCVILAPVYMAKDLADLVRPDETMFVGRNLDVLPAGARPFITTGVYANAAAAFGQNGFLLMAIHEGESSFSAGSRPGIHDGRNDHGCCAGPMQFNIAGGDSRAVGGTGGTWGEYADAFKEAGIERPANYPGRVESPHPNVYDSFDAIYAAAAYLNALDATADLEDDATLVALCRYKGEEPDGPHPNATRDLRRAQKFQELALAGTEGSGDPSLDQAARGGRRPSPDGVVLEVPGRTAQILTSGRWRGLAAAPEEAPPAVKNMIAQANEISGLPYKLLHYPTHIDRPTYDCSSSTSNVLWAGGKFGTAPWCSDRFMSYGQSDPGEWVTIYAKGPCGTPNGQPTGHVFIVIAGLRFDTSSGWDKGVNRGLGGPRWRAGARDMTGFVARHPSGL